MNAFTHIKYKRFLLPGILWLGLVALAYGASIEQIKWRLDLARENLRISEATEARLASELEKLKTSGNAPPELLENYETYLGRVHGMVVENRKLVKEMEATYARLTPPLQRSASSTSGGEEKQVDQKIPEEGELDEMAKLEREFNESLAAFDEMMLKEWDKILARSSQNMRDLAEEMAETDRQGGQKGEGEGTPSEKRTAEGKESEGDSEGQEMEREGGASDAQRESAEGRDTDSKGEGKGAAGTEKQPKRPSGYDDDIVARQLREAAEKETDPELKEKLWKEYEEYKKGSGQ